MPKKHKILLVSKKYSGRWSYKEEMVPTSLAKFHSITTGFIDYISPYLAGLHLNFPIQTNRKMNIRMPCQGTSGEEKHHF